MADIFPSGIQLSPNVEKHVAFHLAGRNYAALPGIEPPVDECIPLRGERRVLNVIPTNPQHIWDRTSFKQYIHQQENEDDVGHRDFNQTLLFWATKEGSIRLPRQLTDYIRGSGACFMVVDRHGPPENLSTNTHGRSSRSIAGGPHLWLGKRLLPVYRLYSDDHRTCIEPLFLENERKLSPIRICTNEPCRPPGFSIPVPSRWAHRHSEQSSASLVGKRALVKDIFEIRGLRHSACSRAYLQMSRPACRTAPMIQELIDAGVAIVGKAKLSSLISREEPSESIFAEYEVPENPRGDAMQSPAGSSSGSAAAVAAYDWLDFAIGSDSTGSARRPAMVNGCFAIRLSTCALPQDGMMPCFPIFDSPAVFARDITDILHVTTTWCKDQLRLSNTKFPTTIMIFSEYDIQNRQQMHIFENFAQRFAALSSLNIRRASLRQMWASSPPECSQSTALYEFLEDVGRLAFYYDFTSSTDEFRAEYERMYHARPAANRVTTWRWEQAQLIKPEQRNEAVRRLEVYKEWLLTTVLTDERPIVLLPIMEAQPNYRDEQSCSPVEAPNAWDQLWLSPILGAPEVTVPIGQIPYHSRMTNREEMLPVAASVMGLAGTDVALVETICDMLERSGRPLRVATGRQIFYEDWEIVERN